MNKLQWFLSKYQTFHLWKCLPGIIQCWYGDTPGLVRQETTDQQQQNLERYREEAHWWHTKILLYLCRRYCYNVFMRTLCREKVSRASKSPWVILIYPDNFVACYTLNSKCDLPPVSLNVLEASGSLSQSRESIWIDIKWSILGNFSTWVKSTQNIFMYLQSGVFRHFHRRIITFPNAV